jgi:RHS repeat-associated protein
VPVVNTGDVLNLNYLPGAVDQNGMAYLGNVEYKTQNGIPSFTTISRINNPEGYASYNTAPYTGYIYYRKDHLGNIREVWHPSSNTTIQRTPYYASGLPWATTPADNLSTQPYKYNGKEYIEMNGLDEYFSQARNYYATLPSTPTMDPLCEKYYSTSPYAWCGGNPVNRIDPNGMDVWSTNDPAEIKVAIESLQNGENIKIGDNSNWSYKSDEQFKKDNEVEGFSMGLNFKNNKLYFGSPLPDKTAGMFLKYLGSTNLDLGDRHFSPDGSYYSLYSVRPKTPYF